MPYNALQCLTMPYNTVRCCWMPFYASRFLAVPRDSAQFQCIPMHSNAFQWILWITTIAEELELLDHFRPFSARKTWRNAFQCLSMPFNAFQCLPMPSNAFLCPHSQVVEFDFIGFTRYSKIKEIKRSLFSCMRVAFYPDWISWGRTYSHFNGHLKLPRVWNSEVFQLLHVLTHNWRPWSASVVN